MKVFLSILVAVTLCFAVLPVTVAQDGSSVPPADYIAAHPANVAIACYDPAAPEDGVYLNEQTRFPLASTLKIAILAAYAQRVAAGEAALIDVVPVEDVDAYYLPGTDGGAHEMFMHDIVLQHTEVTLGELLGGLIVYSSNAVADYLLEQLSEGAIASIFEQLGIQHTDLPFTYLGLYLVMSNHETGAASADEMTAETFQAEHARLSALYLTNPDWRAAELTFRETPAEALPGYAAQQAFLARFGMQGTAADLATLMRAGYQGKSIPPLAQVIMQNYLDWPLHGGTPLNDHFDHFGTKGGSWPGILTAIYFTVDDEGQALALALFYRDLAPDQWVTWATEFDHQALELDAIRTRCDALADALGIEPAATEAAEAEAD